MKQSVGKCKHQGDLVNTDIKMPYIVSKFYSFQTHTLKCHISHKHLIVLQFYSFYGDLVNTYIKMLYIVLKFYSFQTHALKCHISHKNFILLQFYSFYTKILEVNFDIWHFNVCVYQIAIIHWCHLVLCDRNAIWFHKI